MSKVKSFEGKENALWEKMPKGMFKWYNSHWSQMKHDKYWVFVFTKPAGYAHKMNETEWWHKVWVWDTDEEKFIVKLPNIPYRNVTAYLINYDYTTIVIVTAETTIIFNWKTEVQTTIEMGCQKSKEFEWFMPQQDAIIAKAPYMVYGHPNYKPAWVEIDLANDKFYYYRGLEDPIADRKIQTIHLGNKMRAIIAKKNGFGFFGHKISIWEFNHPDNMTIGDCMGVIDLAGYIPDKDPITLRGNTLLSIGEIKIPIKYLRDGCIN